MRLFARFDKPEKVVIISGVMRSGTTLLQRILVTADGANPLAPEFERPRKVMMLAQQKFWNKSRLQRNLHTEIAAFWRRQGYPKVLIGKDPLLTPLIAPFTSLLPDIKNVIALRDPRDTVSSILAVRERMRTDGVPDNLITNMSATGVVAYVMKQVKQISKVQNKRNVCVVRYEELVSQDPKLRDRLSDFIGAEISFDIPDAREQFQNNTSYFYSPVSGATLTHERIGAYRQLPAHIQAHFEKYRERFTELGYCLDSGLTPDASAAPPARSMISVSQLAR